MKPRLWGSLDASVPIIYVNNRNLDKAACPVYDASRFHAFHNYMFFFDLLFDRPEILSLQNLTVLVSPGLDCPNARCGHDHHACGT